MTDDSRDSSGRLTKHVFLEFRKCGRRGWLLHHPVEAREALGLGEQFRLAQGNAVGDVARQMLGPGADLRGPATAAWIEETRSVLSTPEPANVYEAPIAAGSAVARPDAIIREPGWCVIEVKSAKNEKDEYVDDLAYTVAVAQAAGFAVTGAELALVNAEWRVDNDRPALVRLDVTEGVLARAAEFASLLEPAYRTISAADAPPAELKAACRGCEFFRTRCFETGLDDPVFELPRIVSKRVDDLIATGITRISEVPDGERLSPLQQFHRRAVLEGALVTEPAGFGGLAAMRAPVGYLDFETLSLALPPFVGMAPYDIIPIQYSLHRRTPTGALEHRELLLDPLAPDIEQFTMHLLESLAGLESIVVYSAFERSRLRWLAERIPRLAGELEGVVGRLVDLLPIVQGAVAHPNFHGSLSIKKVLPVLVPDLSYLGLAIGNGDDAMGVVGLRAMGRVADDEWARYRGQLLEYCAVDTLAVVRLHEALAALAK